MRRWIAFFALLVFVFSSFGTHAEAATFNDLGKKHRFYSEMTFLEGKKIITGYPDQTIRPDEKVTRAAAAIMIGKALGLDGKQRDTKFPDVGKNQKASGYVDSAVERGIISGFEDETFRPNAPVTRGQMAIFLSRAFNLNKEASIPFKDVSPSAKNYTYIKRIIAANLTSGYEDNTYRPNAGITRAQFSAFLARALDDRFKVEIPVAPTTYLMDKSKAYHYYTENQGNKVKRC